MKEHFILRVELDKETVKNFQRDCKDLVNHRHDFDDVISTSWSPKNDAKTRILDARERARQMDISFMDIPEGGLENRDLM